MQIGQTAPNSASGSKMTAMEKMQALVENGIDVYILRWKRKNPFPCEMFGFDNVRLVERFDNNIMATVYDKVPVRGEATRFEATGKPPVPTAYVPDIPSNRYVLMSILANAPFIIAGKATFGMVMPSEKAVKELVEWSKTAPPLKEKKYVMRDLNGKLLSGGDKAETGTRLLTAEECYEVAEKEVHAKNDLFCKHLRKKHGSNNWKRIKDYKDTILQEVIEVYHKKLAISGLKDTLNIAVAPAEDKDESSETTEEAKA